MGLVWAWAALSMLLTYRFVLSWHEWWQYVLAAGVVAALCLYFASMMSKDAAAGRQDDAILNIARYLTIGQLAGMVIAMVGMIIDDKMPRDPREPDWAANAMFFFGAAALAAISAYALWGRRRNAPEPPREQRISHAATPDAADRTARLRIEHRGRRACRGARRERAAGPRRRAVRGASAADALAHQRAAWRAGTTHTPAADWAWSNTVLTAIVYAWGAAALFSIYGLSGLHLAPLVAIRSRHGAARRGGACYAPRHLASERGLKIRASTLNIIMAITVAQAVSIVGALVYLVASGSARHAQRRLGREPCVHRRRPHDRRDLARLPAAYWRTPTPAPAGA